ncbi:MAG TPA: TIGR02680 family protein [Aldersonia sp.]
MIRTLPVPVDRRWKPLRAGLVDLFYYDQEEFWFRDGRLLLRGNNGTGKSKVLALLLPFLLDGDLSAHRVEPDADPKKRMEWNLLLGGAHPHAERIGYSWLEFGRRDEDGHDHFCTIGCGMKAVTGKGVSPWFFVTTARVGADLQLVDAHGTPLAKDRLAESLGERGRRYDKARDYRRAVDEALFRLGEQRYGALVDLLIQLRQPQLSKRPSETALSNALTESLPPLGQAVLADVAEAFRSLEEDRAELTDMREARDAALGFLGHYRRYARVASRRKAEEPRKAQSKYEQLNRDLAEANRDFGEAEERLGEIGAKIETLDETEAAQREHQQALRDSKAMDSARDLESARTAAAKAAESAAKVELLCNDAQNEARRRQDRVDDAQTALDAVAAARDEVRHAVRIAADGAAIADRHERDVDARLEYAPVAELRRSAEQLADRQKAAVDHLNDRITAVEDAQRDLVSARQRMTELDARAMRLGERRDVADADVERLADRFVQTNREHLTSTRELVLADLDYLLGDLAGWTRSLDGANPVTVVAERRRRDVVDQIVREDTAAAATEHQLRSALGELADELARLEAGETAVPPARHTVDAREHDARAGAPLWRLVDFAEHVEPEARAGLEAALEAAGLVDAWVSVGGELIASGDVVVRAGDAAVGATLADMLRPAIDPDVSLTESVVAGVLAAIGLGAASAHHSWVDVDGRFRVGVLEGAWRKPEAQYVGAGAREQTRRRRIAVLQNDIVATRSQIAQVEEQRASLGERRERVDAEFAGLPADAALRSAHDLVARLAQQYADLRFELDAASAALDAATSVHRQRAAELEADALDSALPADPEQLRVIADRIVDYRVQAAQLWEKLEAHATAGRAAHDAGAELERATAHLTDLRARVSAEQRDAAGAHEYFRTLESTVGAEVQEVLQALGLAADALKATRAVQKAAAAERDEWIEQRGGAASRQALLGGQLDEVKAQRLDAVESMRHFAATGLLRVALPELELPDPAEPWAPNPTVLLARSIESALESVDYDEKAFDRLQARISSEHKALGDVLSRQGNSTSAQPIRDAIVVDVVFRGKSTTVPDLAATLDAEVADRSRLLSEREREILENHLVSEVASTLQELIFAAEQQVARMNQELDARPTSTGMKLRLYWEPGQDAPPGAAEAQRQLRQTADAWNEVDRASVGEFLQNEIERVRADRVGGTWLEHLTEALDYRCWNRFVIKRQQNGQWRSATGPASGGERVLAASVPLFAAASAHYASAGNPDAPRLVTLDEAFAGVDDNARAKYLGLLAAFDLDVVMTSEREWGCYPEVPGLAIAHLSRIDGVDAVLVTNWEWDGCRREHVDRPLPGLTQVVEDDHTGSQGGLWSTD